jgi:hypothetical protein
MRIHATSKRLHFIGHPTPRTASKRRFSHPSNYINCQTRPIVAGNCISCFTSQGNPLLESYGRPLPNTSPLCLQRQDIMETKNSYDPVPHHESYSDRLSDEDAAPVVLPPQKRRALLPRLLAGLVFVGLTAGMVLAVCITLRHSGDALASTDSSNGILHCGETPAEARSRGCKYDPMMQMWMPLECYDEHHSEMFLKKGAWKWYEDIYATREIPDEVMRLGEHEVSFVKDSYHRQHCLYTWELMVRALRAQKPLVEEMLSEEHVEHCHMMIFAPPWNTTKYPMGTEAHSGYARCAPIDVWMKNLPEESLHDVYFGTR